MSGQSALWTARLRGLRGTRGLPYLSTAVAIAVVAAVLLAGSIAPHDPYEQSLTERKLAPDLFSAHPFGTDDVGRDVLSRVLHGGRPPLLIGIVVVVLAVVVGVAAGLLAGYRGGVADTILSRLADLQLSIPGIVLALLALSLLGTSMTVVALVLAAESWPLHFRMSRATAAAARHRAYVESARNNGAPAPTILRRHVLPELAPVLCVTASMNFVGAVLAQASLSFLGLGVQPPTPDWGLMVSMGRTQLASAWWISVAPGVFLVLVLFATQRISDFIAARASLSGVSR